MADTTTESVYIQNNTTPGVSAASCGGSADNANGVIHLGMEEGGTAGATEVLHSLPKASGSIRITQFLSPAFAASRGIYGTGTSPVYRLNITTGDANVFLRQITACVYDSAGVAAGSLLDSAVFTTEYPFNAGIMTVTVATTSTALLSTVPAGGFIGISIIAENTAAHSSASIGITPSENFDMGCGYIRTYGAVCAISGVAAISPIMKGNSYFMDNFNHDNGAQLCGTTPDILGTSWASLDGGDCMVDLDTTAQDKGVPGKAIIYSDFSGAS